MGISRYNSEGYSDPTSHAALSGIRKEERVAKRAYRPLVYICSPFAGDTEGNTQKARRYSRFAVKKGYRAHYKGDAPTWKDGKVANTLNTFNVGESRCNELVVQAYGICSKDSNAMKSDNPHSGFYEADTSRTLDGNGGNPSCNQGGIAVVPKGKTHKENGGKQHERKVSKTG